MRLRALTHVVPLTVALGLSFCPQAAEAQYLHLYTIWEAVYNVTDVGTLYQNPHSYAEDVPIPEGSFDVIKSVAGSYEACPWSSKFTPLGVTTTNTVTFPATVVYNVQPGQYINISITVQNQFGEQGFDPHFGGGGGPGAGGQIADDPTHTGYTVGNPPLEADFVRNSLVETYISHDYIKSWTYYP